MLFRFLLTEMSSQGLTNFSFSNFLKVNISGCCINVCIYILA